MSKSKVMMAGAGEKFQYLAHDYNDNTIRFLLRYPGLLDPDTLRAATNAVIQGADILHGSFFNDPVSAYWMIHGEYDESSYFQYIRVAGDPMVTAESLSLLPVFPESQTQLRCLLIQSESESVVVLSISHLCVDGGDGKYLLEKLVESYNLILSTGNAEALEIKNGNRAPEQIYEGTSVKALMSLMKMPGSDVKSGFPYANENPGRLNMVRVSIPADVMSAARKRAKTESATANDLLLTALYRAYGAMPEIDEAAPMSIMSMMDLRRHCDDGESDGLANMSGTFPTTLHEGSVGSFSHVLAQISEQTRTAKEDPVAGMTGLPLIHGAVRTIPMKVLMMVSEKFYGSMSLGMTNLGNIPCATLAMGDLIPTEGVFGGPVKKKPGMQVSAASFDGTCALCVAGQYTKEDAVQLQGLLDSVVKEIANYAENG